MEGIKRISFNIFAKDDEEALRGEQAIKNFISLMCSKGVRVTGDKIAEAVGNLNDGSFVMNRIIQFFLKK